MNSFETASSYLHSQWGSSMTINDKKMSLNTRLIHEGKIEDDAYDSIVTPIYQSTTFYAQEYKDVRYPRFNNTPNQIVLHSRLADVEEADTSLVTASGMAAITTAILAVLKAGDHLIAQRCLYGNTFTFFENILPRFGIEVDYVDVKNAQESLPVLIKPNTKAVYTETLSNPLVSITDLQGVVEVCKSHGLLSLIDNTFASPVLFKPIPFGFDFSLHSATKYLNGHSDLTAGVISGPGDLMETVNMMAKTLGGNIDPHAAFLLERGLKTLPLRVLEQNKNAVNIAEFLESRAEVEKVHYPGLQSHEDYDKAKKYFAGAAGGLVSFDLKGGLKAAKKFVSALHLISASASLGGVESLVMIPAIVSHALVPRKERLAMGVNDGLVRLAAGIEDSNDLIGDIAQALDHGT